MITKVQDSDISVARIAAKAGIPTPTLYYWVQQAKIAAMSSRSTKKKRGRPRKSTRFSPEEQLRLLVEASALSDAHLGVFLRKEGLHEVDLQGMRDAALAGLTPPVVRRGLSPQEQELKALKLELRRKEKALAEAAALLVLQKKFRALLAGEGDDTDEIFGDD